MSINGSVQRLAQDHIRDAFTKAQGRADFLLLTCPSQGHGSNPNGIVDCKEEVTPVLLANLEADLVHIFGKNGRYDIEAVYDLTKDFQNAEISKDALPSEVIASAKRSIAYLEEVAAYVSKPWYKRCLQAEPAAPT